MRAHQANKPRGKKSRGKTARHHARDSPRKSRHPVASFTSPFFVSRQRCRSRERGRYRPEAMLSVIVLVCDRSCL
jgi:hypothetical protein